MIETTEIIEPWLYATLSEDPTLAGLVGDRILGTMSSDMPQTPYVIFLLTSPRDIVGVGGTRISTDNLYVVKGVSQTNSWDVLTPIAARIDQLIHRPGSTMLGEDGGSLTCIREMIHQMPEIADGLPYRHLGGVYRIRASADD
jgi:hypothetical protein